MFYDLYNTFLYFIKYRYEILFTLCIVSMLLIGLYQKIVGKKGSWSHSYFYSPFLQKDREDSLQKRPRIFDSKGELECRRVLQKLFRKQFQKIRPDFLSNSVTGGKHNLEIDCYDEELRLGVEYQGQQHYKYTPFFHRNHESFLNQKYRDELKRMLLKQNNINLIEVPYTVKIENIENYLVNELRNLRYFK